MPKPKRTQKHVVDTKGKKYLEQHIPDEWFYNTPAIDYGIDYSVEIAINGQVTGLNFSIQLKSHNNNSNQEFAKAVIKRSTLSYYKVRLEPVMIVVYEKEHKQAYWIWVNDLDFDLTKQQKEYTFKVPKRNTIEALDWNEVLMHVQTVFNNRSFISDFDISKIHNNIELAAWKVYNDGNYEQAVYLFRKMIQDGYKNFNHYQALSWSLYSTYRYNEALTIINDLVATAPTENLLQMKACVLAESGISHADKGKIIQARDLFKKSSGKNSTFIIHYNYGNTLSALGNHRAAIEQYNICIHKDSNFAPCWKNLGTCYGELGDHAEELKCYETALAIDPNLKEALFSMGISLAKDFHQHKEALVYFERALVQKNSFSMNFINGLYWVALSYQHISDFQNALYWLDYGLNFSSNNPYLLNIKGELLANNWKQYPKLTSTAKEFFEYRIELDDDPRSLHHLLVLEGMDLATAFPILQQHTALYKMVSIEDLQSISFDMTMCLNTLLHMRLLNTFKKDHLVTRYLNHLISDLYTIGDRFWQLLDLVTSHAFAVGVNTWLKTKSSEEAIAAIFETLTDYVPSLIPILIRPVQQLSDEEKEMLVLFAVAGLKTIVERETGAQSAYIGHQYKAITREPEQYISQDMNIKLMYNLLVAGHEFKQSQF